MPRRHRSSGLLIGDAAWHLAARSGMGAWGRIAGGELIGTDRHGIRWE